MDCGRRSRRRRRHARPLGAGRSLRPYSQTDPRTPDRPAPSRSSSSSSAPTAPSRIVRCAAPSACSRASRKSGVRRPEWTKRIRAASPSCRGVLHRHSVGVPASRAAFPVTAPLSQSPGGESRLCQLRVAARRERDGRHTGTRMERSGARAFAALRAAAAELRVTPRRGSARRSGAWSPVSPTSASGAPGRSGASRPSGRPEPSHRGMTVTIRRCSS
jgi:hypothetical protein